MSSTAKIIWGIIIVVVLGGGYWLWSTREAQAPTSATSMTSPSDTSDRALDKDTASIDAGLSAAAADSSTANGTLNDKPVAQ